MRFLGVGATKPEGFHISPSVLQMEMAGLLSNVWASPSQQQHPDVYLQL